MEKAKARARVRNNSDHQKVRIRKVGRDRSRWCCFRLFVKRNKSKIIVILLDKVLSSSSNELQRLDVPIVVRSVSARVSTERMSSASNFDPRYGEAWLILLTEANSWNSNADSIMKPEADYSVHCHCGHILSVVHSWVERRRKSV